MFGNIDTIFQPDEHGQGTFDNRLLQRMRLKKDDELYEFLRYIPNVGALVDYRGRTLLHYAAKYGCCRTVYLLHLSTDVSLKDWHGKTAFQLATTTKTIDYLLGDDGFGHDDKIRRLVKYLSTRRRFDRNTNSAIPNYDLGMTVNEIAEKLIEFNYSIHVVVKFRRAEVTREMLALGCSPLVDPNSSLCPADTLVFAIRSSDFENARVLLDYGYDVNAENSSGQTALSSYFACRDADQRDRLEMLRLLLNRGANPMAIVTSQERMSRFSDDADPGEMQMATILKYDKKEMIRTLLDANIDLNTKDAKGRTAIHYIAMNDQPGAFGELMNKEYDVNVRDNDGSTPLHLISRCNLQTARILYERGADINAVDHSGMTVLMKIWKNRSYRCRSPQCHSVNPARLTEFLLHNGADPQFIVSYRRFPYLSSAFSFDPSLKCVLIPFLLTEARGKATVAHFASRISQCDQLTYNLKTYKSVLEKMKKVRIYKSLSAYDLLIKSDAKIERYARNRKFQLRLHQVKKHIIHLDYYKYALRNRIVKAVKMARMRKQAITDLSNILELSADVVDNIASYLSESDLKKICDVKQ